MMFCRFFVLHNSFHGLKATVYEIALLNTSMFDDIRHLIIKNRNTMKKTLFFLSLLMTGAGLSQNCEITDVVVVQVYECQPTFNGNLAYPVELRIYYNNEPSNGTLIFDGTSMGVSEAYPATGSPQLIAVNNIPPNTATDFTVYFLNDPNCSFTSINPWPVQDCSTTSLSEEKIENHYSIYPNPSSGSFTLSLNSTPNELERIEIISILGKKVYELQITEKEILIDLNNQQKGVYLARILDKSGKVQIKKLVIQ